MLDSIDPCLLSDHMACAWEANPKHRKFGMHGVQFT